MLQLDDVVPSSWDSSMSVPEVLLEKHAPSCPSDPASLVVGAAPPTHDVIYDSIDAATIKCAALKKSGGAGPSGIDAHGWRRLITCFDSASRDLSGTC